MTNPRVWPALLTKEQLRAYLGGMSEDTLGRVCPVPPIDLGVHLVRYHRGQIDDWLATLPPRLLRLAGVGKDAEAVPAAQIETVAASRPLSAVERARSRADRAR